MNWLGVNKVTVGLVLAVGAACYFTGLAAGRSDDSLTACREREADCRAELREANEKISAQVETLQALLFQGAPFVE